MAMKYSALYSERPYYRLYTGPYHGMASRADKEIKSEIQDNLSWDQWVDATKIHVEVTNAVVTLTGTVGSFVEKRSAGDDAADVLGVADVKNNLKLNNS